MAPDNVYDPMDFNHDGSVSNIELSAAVNEVGRLAGRKKHPLLTKILLGVAFAALGAALFVVFWLLIYYKKTTELIIFAVIAVICIGYGIWVFVKARRIKKIMAPEPQNSKVRR